MKLLILLSIIASGYGDKLDRTYLPPSSAGSAGGSPGALTAPGLSSFGVAPSLGQQPFGQPAGKNTFTQQSSQSTGPSGQQNPGSSFERKNPSFGSSLSVGKPSSVYLPVGGRTSQANNALNSGFGSSAPSGSTINQPSYFGGSNVPSSGSSQEAPRNTFTSSGPSQQASSFNQANEQNASGFSSKSNQPERPQAAADRNAEILRYVNENDGDRFTYSFETSNGISAEESGVASGGVKAQGGYSYTGDDGKSYTITYTADEQGFVPQGEHLPTPHPIPEEILKSIEKNAQAAAAGTQEGAYRPEEYESEDNVQRYNSGVISSNIPQGQVQESNQKYTPSRTPASEGLGSTQAGSQVFAPNIPASQSGSIDTLNNALSQPSSFGGLVGSSNQGFAAQNNKVKQGFGPNNQVQSQIQGGSGYQYSRPQYSSGPSSFNQTPGSQSRPQFGSQYRPSSQASTEVNQGQQGQFGSSSEASQASGVGSQYQPVSSKSPSQPDSSGYQYQPATSTFTEPSTQGITALEGNQNQYQSGPSKQYSNQPTSNQAQYRPVSTQTTSQNSFNRPNEQSTQNQPGLVSTYSSPQGQNRSPSNQPGSGFSDSGAKGSAIQAPYQYKRPTQTLSPQSQSPLKPSFEKSTPSFTQGQGPVQQRYNQPTQGQNPSQSGFNRPIQGQGQAQPGFNQQTQDQGPSQSDFNRPIQGQAPAQPGFNQQTQGQGPSQSGFNRPIQGQAPAQPGFKQQTQGQGPSQSGFNRPIQGQALAQPGFNQQTQGQGLSQSGFNRPIQSQGSAQPGYNQETQDQRPSQLNFNRPIQGQGSAQPGFNQQTQGQGPSQLGFNQPDQSLSVQEQSIKRPTKPDQFVGPRQPPSYNPQEGYKY